MAEHPNLASALAAFQAEVPIVIKGHTASAGSYSYRYASLADVTSATMPLLAEHGLSFTCRPRQRDGRWELRGELLHSAGERLSGCLPIGGANAQELGASVTYARRYLLGCLTGAVTDEDTDGVAPLARGQAGKPRS